MELGSYRMYLQSNSVHWKLTVKPAVFRRGTIIL
jgi:hypothetical protein